MRKAQPGEGKERGVRGVSRVRGVLVRGEMYGGGISKRGMEMGLVFNGLN